MFSLIGNFFQSISVAAGALVMGISGLFGTAVPIQTESEVAVPPPVEVTDQVSKKSEIQSPEEKYFVVPNPPIPQSVNTPIIPENVAVPTNTAPIEPTSEASQDSAVLEREVLQDRINRLVAECNQITRKYDANILDLQQEFYDYRTAVYQAPTSARVMDGRVAQKESETNAAIAQIQIERQRNIMKCEDQLAKLGAN